MSANCRWKGASHTNHCWCQKTRVITLSCGIKITAMHCLVLSQSTRVTDGRTDGQNYESQDGASIAASRGKNFGGCVKFEQTIIERNYVL